MTTGINTLNLPHVRVAYQKQAKTVTDRQDCENELNRASCAENISGQHKITGRVPACAAS
jgi:hypothetical protein